MARLLRACLYNGDPDTSEGLRASITALNFVRLDTETATPEDLSSAIHA